MKISELMANHTPRPEYAGFADADTWVLGIKTSDSEKAPKDFDIFQVGAKDQSVSFNPKTASTTYVRAGEVTVKTGNAGKIKLEFDRCYGDAAQDFLASHKIIWGTGEQVKTQFVYFNYLTGKGISGEGNVIMDDGPNQSAGNNGTFSGNLFIIGTPEEYTYSALP